MPQTVLITGGTSGIGLSLARSFVDLGANVVVCARSQAALDRFAQEHPQALAVRADVTDPVDRAALLQAVADRFERVDVRAGEDHSGDPALFIDAYYGLSDTPLDARLISHTLTELRDLLLKMGEKRFPYVRHHFDERQAVAGQR